MTERVNIELLRSRAGEIRASLEKIRVYTAISDEEFFADERNLYSVMHLLLICVEGVAAICNHLLARLARKAPASYGECFQGLQELDILDEPLVSRLVQMARFRNMLVHRYWQIDRERILRYARENLDDFDLFLRRVGAIAGKNL